MTSNNKGFSLMEVLIAMLVLAIGILGLVKLQSYVQQRADLAEHQMQALALAEQQLETFRTRTREGKPTVSNSISFDNINSGPLAKEGVFTQKVVVAMQEHQPEKPAGSTIVPPPITYAKHIKVIVSWEDRAGKPHEVALETVIAAYSEFD